ncbi:formylglycine-generating enzyme family protein [Candidatus Nitrotoga sp. M5]|uniref:formylglycine-generating enzyme family protein n=1 Tax=Candidatus Nitrotoga sp. M5 TaxID=2890409 RepID=UPI001EF50742|nr:SUMF1/EgtB/PvdO family nonheme iron enzyme [Candidatus Nitrotoga sp. M5]CAH1388127.1 FGE-sulfatase domain-containing protein [Candidatus Nitrotoga sp. M5]
MAVIPNNGKSELPAADIARRKRYLSATFVVCFVLLAIGITLYVVSQGFDRMGDMRSSATYDLKDEYSRIRAAGEDLVLHSRHEAEKNKAVGYSAIEVESLLSKEEWLEIESMVLIPDGAFLMGTDLERADVQNHPQHTVNLPAFWINKYPVTNAQYAKFVVATSHRPPLNWKEGKIPHGEILRPVTMVSWYDASAYAKWAGKRLPSEAEWEKSARGNDGRRWPWGNKMDPDRLNTYYNVGSTTNVNVYLNGASPYGVMDMAGNVSEWMADDFAPYPGTDAPPDLFKGKILQATNKKEVEIVPAGRRYKVLRGGSWKGDPFSTSVFHRNFAFANFASDFFGFRCASDFVEEDKRE